MALIIPSTKTDKTDAAGVNVRFDWAVVVLSGWLVGGIHLDAWAHHRIAATLETFFTPWHGVLYSGFFALAGLLIGAAGLNARQGSPWRKAAPPGYSLSLLGVLVFFLGGLGDMVWHLLFGIEVGTEALLSPTHLLLALGGGLMITGPIRTALVRKDNLWPALVALSYLLALFLFFTAYANPLSEGSLATGARPVGEEIFLREGLGVSGVLLYAVMAMGLALFAVRHWRLPFGGLSLLFGVSTLLAVSPHEAWDLLPAAFLSGAVADVMLRWIKPSPQRPVTFRLFAFLVPVVFFALYFATLALTDGLWWRVHLWAGVPLLAGAVAWLLSYAFAPPVVPEVSR